MNYSKILEELFLKQEEYLGNNKHVNNIIPTVSVHVITYQHVNYIEDCLKGILMQKTNFPIEIVIGEDESEDGTREICKKYAEEYPNKIRLFLRDRNKSVLKENGQTTYFNGKLTLKTCRGKYIALCEGDDYWTDPLKLQKQVDFLEKNPDCSLCFHASKSIRNNNPENYSIHKPKKLPADNKFEMKHAILGGGGFMATNSMLFFKEYIEERPEWMNEAPVGDLPLMLLLASKGKIGYIDDVMSVYRVMSSASAWSASMQNRARRKKHHCAILKMWTGFDNWTGKKYHRFVVRKKMKNKWNYYKWQIKHLQLRIFKNIKL